MNEVFISGEIISKIEYKFIINSKKNAILKFELKLDNNSIVKCIACDSVADYCYRKLKEKQYINLEGKIRNSKKSFIEITTVRN